MNSNPLDPIWKAYEVSIDSFEIVQEVIKQQKAHLFTGSNWANQSNARQDVVATIKEIEALFVFSLWATFDRKNLQGFQNLEGFVILTTTTFPNEYESLAL